MSRQIDQNIDPVGADAFGETLIGIGSAVTPASRCLFQPLCHCIPAQHVGITHRVKCATVVLSERRFEKIGYGVIAEIR